MRRILISLLFASIALPFFAQGFNQIDENGNFTSAEDTNKKDSLKEHHDVRRGAVAVALCVALVAILHTPALHFTDRTQVIITTTIVVTLYTTGLSLILALPMRIGLIKRCFDFLGSISLELFLVHTMIIAAVRKFLGWEHWQVCVAFIASVAVAYAVHRAAKLLTRHTVKRT